LTEKTYLSPFPATFLSVWSFPEQKLHFHAQFTPIYKLQLHMPRKNRGKQSKACGWANQSRGMSASQFV